MIINIEDKVLQKIKSIMEKRNTTIYKILDSTQPLLYQNDILSNAREVKTNKKKDDIKKAIKEMICSDIQPTKYKLHKKTGVSYITLNKYFNELFDEVLKEIKS